MVAWSYYGDTGYEIPEVEVTGRILRAASNTIFILLLILMAKGYTITRGRLATSSAVKITVFMVIYCVVISVLFIWEGLFFDAGLVLYYYESPPGYGLVAMQCIAWVWFLYSLVFTLKHCSTKNTFYIPFFSFYTLWFWAGPTIILVAMFAMAKWSREKTVNGVQQLAGFIGHAFFLFLTRPNAANANFPFTIRTTQIASLGEELTEGGGNPYVITGPDLEFFTIKRDHEMGVVDLESRELTPGRPGPSAPPIYKDLPPPYSMQGAGSGGTTRGFTGDNGQSSSHFGQNNDIEMRSLENNPFANNNSMVADDQNRAQNADSLNFISNVNSSFQVRNSVLSPPLAGGLSSGLPPTATKWTLPPIVRGQDVGGFISSDAENRALTLKPSHATILTSHLNSEAVGGAEGARPKSGKKKKNDILLVK